MATRTRYQSIQLAILLFALTVSSVSRSNTDSTVMKAGLIEMAESYAAPLINFAKTILVKYELSAMARTITVKAIGKNIVPTPATFRQYLRETMQSSRDPSLDMWDTPYVFQRKGKIGIITSCGPDKKCGTADDLLTKVDLP